MTCFRAVSIGWFLVFLLAAGLAIAGDDAATTRPLQVCLISGPHYKADESLGGFKEYLEKNYHVQCSRVITEEYPKGKDLPGIEVLDKSDVMVVYTRRIEVPVDQLERVKKWCTEGKPVLGIRTASHAFQNWSRFSEHILGAKFGPHYNNAPMQVSLAEKGKDHPILTGIQPFSTKLGLYKYEQHAPELNVLLLGKVDGHDAEPVAWSREVNGGRVFYTSLGGTEDFQDPMFKQLLVNALCWLTERDAAKLKK